MTTILKILGVLFLLIWTAVGALILAGIVAGAVFIKQGGPQKIMGSFVPSIMRGAGGLLDANTKR